MYTFNPNVDEVNFSGYLVNNESLKTCFKILFLTKEKAKKKEKNVAVNIRLSTVTVSLHRQQDINRNSSVTQLIYLKIIYIVFMTKERILKNMSYYLLKSPLTRTHGKS